jgi:hypothetical protein
VAGQARWHEDFEALPAARRACRFDPDGHLGLASCEHGFDCEGCERFARLGDRRMPAESDIYVHGIAVLADRRYHRGHTWVRDEADGTALVGLDPLARRSFDSESFVAPARVGDRLTPGDAVFEDASEALRVLTPLPGEVVEVLGNGPETVVRLIPATESRDQLLSGTEAAGWMESELRWLSARFANDLASGPTLADGGDVVDCLPESVPSADWKSLREELFLDV